MGIYIKNVVENIHFQKYDFDLKAQFLSLATDTLSCFPGSDNTHFSFRKSQIPRLLVFPSSEHGFPWQRQLTSSQPAQHIPIFLLSPSTRVPCAFLLFHLTDYGKDESSRHEMGRNVSFAFSRTCSSKAGSWCVCFCREYVKVKNRDSVSETPTALSPTNTPGGCPVTTLDLSVLQANTV